ncbi:MAG: glycoside hydrolase family 65 protein, partial [Gammaproteobacteria bacterium]|nr:glycoside hydrolase family 65 protein [Gammaproteobacteria bacterium]
MANPVTARSAGLLCALALAAAAQAETDPTFLLNATRADWAGYFPSYLANGYLSSMTGPRGTESNPAYLVAFMDYKTEDIARPAAIPGWSGIDYSTGKSSAGQFWLNNTKLADKSFAEYGQTLNLYEATLSTHYRYTDDSHKRTAVTVTTFASEAAPHLAASQLAITPEFSGTVQLTFWFTVWAEHQPRFPIRTMNGEEMQAAVAANDMTVLEPVNQATPDRAPVWYYGHTEVRAGNADARELTFWLDGRALEGLTMAEAAAVGVPEDAQPTEVKVIRTPYQLGLTLSVPVQAGHTYRFTKYVAVA